MDPISIILSLASVAYQQSKCSSCSRFCDPNLARLGTPGCSQGYVTPCCSRMFCDTHIRGWAQGVQRNGGVCPFCHLNVQ
jgi:hypothetical protein